MEQLIPRPLSAEHPEMAPGRANPMAAASSQPAVRQPAGQMNNTATPATPPPMTGTIQPGLPPTPDTKTAALCRAEIHSLLYKFGMASVGNIKRANALRRAEIYSCLYKHGAALKPKAKKELPVSSEFKSTTGRDAAIGAGLGAAGGAALGAHTVPYIPKVEPTAEMDALIKNSPGLEGIERALEALKPQLEIPTAFRPRLSGAIKSLGANKVLKAAAKLGLVGAGIGAVGGLGVGLAEHGFRKRKQ